MSLLRPGHLMGSPRIVGAALHDVASLLAARGSNLTYRESL